MAKTIMDGSPAVSGTPTKYQELITYLRLSAFNIITIITLIA